jgi:hypothetical protein
MGTANIFTRYWLITQGSQGLADRQREDPLEVTQILRHRFLAKPIAIEADRLHNSVERVIGEYGLQKKGYIKQIRNTRKL